MTTAGKGPGVTLRASDCSGTLHAHLSLEGRSGVVSVLDVHGSLAQVELSPDELRAVAQALLRMASAASWVEASEITQER